MPELVVPQDAKESYDEWMCQQGKREIFDCPKIGAMSNCVLCPKEIKARCLS